MVIVQVNSHYVFPTQNNLDNLLTAVHLSEVETYFLKALLQTLSYAIYHITENI